MVASSTTTGRELAMAEREAHDQWFRPRTFPAHGGDRRRVARCHPRRAGPDDGGPGKPRFLGVDAAAVALVRDARRERMETLWPDSSHALAGMTMIGRSATLFVMVPGSASPSSPARRRPRPARGAANIAWRVLIDRAIGLALGYIATIWVILAYYGASPARHPAGRPGAADAGRHRREGWW